MPLVRYGSMGDTDTHTHKITIKNHVIKRNYRDK